MTVLMPVAMPTSDCGTAATMRFAIAAKENAMPAPSSMPETTTSHSCPCANAISAMAPTASAAPIARTARKPMRVPRRPASEPVSSCVTAAGIMSSPATVTDAAKP